MNGIRFLFLLTIAAFTVCIKSPHTEAPALTSPKQSGVKVEDVPTFTMRARVVSSLGKPAAGRRFVMHLRGATTELDGDAWTPWWKFDRAMAGSLLRGSYPVVI